MREKRFISILVIASLLLSTIVFISLLVPKAIHTVIPKAAGQTVVNTWIPEGPSPQIGHTVPGGVNGIPVSGMVTVIAFSPNYDGKQTPAMYIGTAGGGVWRSIDFKSNNPTWTSLSDGIGDKLGLPYNERPGLLNIHSITIDQEHPQTVFVGSDGVGILKSEDGGNTWSIMGQSVIGGISSLLIDPTDPSDNTLYVAAYGKIYKSSVGGKNWTQEAIKGLTSYNVGALDYTIDASNRLRLYAGVTVSSNTNTIDSPNSNGIWVSSNNGADWAHMPIDLVSRDTQVIGTKVGQNVVVQAQTISAITLVADHTPHYPYNIYATMSQAADGKGHLINVFALAYNGSKWIPIGPPPPGIDTQDGANQAIGISPSGILYLQGYPAGGPFTYRSVDQGETWTSIGHANPNSDGHAWAFTTNIPNSLQQYLGKGGITDSRWKAITLSKITGQQMFGDLTSWQTSWPTMVQHIAGVSKVHPSSGHLIVLSFEKQQGLNTREIGLNSNWKVQDVTQITGGQEVFDSPIRSWVTPDVVFTDRPFAVEHIAAISSPGGHVLVFSRAAFPTPNSNWKVEDVTQITGGQNVETNTPLTSWQTLRGVCTVGFCTPIIITQNIAATAPNNDLLVFSRDPTNSKWKVEDVTQITGTQKIEAELTSWLAPDILFTTEHIAGVTLNGHLLVFSRDLGANWKVQDLTQITGMTFPDASDLPSWNSVNLPFGIAGPATTVQHIAAESRNHLLVFSREQGLFSTINTDWKVEDVTQITGGQNLAAFAPLTSWQSSGPRMAFPINIGPLFSRLGSTEQHIAAVSTSLHLLVFSRNYVESVPGFNVNNWKVEDVTQITGGPNPGGGSPPSNPQSDLNSWNVTIGGTLPFPRTDNVDQLAAVTQNGDIQMYLSPASGPNDDTAYAGNDGGIWRYGPQTICVDIGTGCLLSWNSMNTKGLQTHLVHGASMNPVKHTFVEGSQDNGAALSSGSSAWGHLACTSPCGGDNGKTRFDPTGSFIYTTEHGDLWRFNADGSHGKKIDPQGQAGVTSFAISQINGKHLVASSDCCGQFHIYQTFNNGDSWSPILSSGCLHTLASSSSCPSPSGSMGILAIAPTDDNTIVGIDGIFPNQKVWKRSNTVGINSPWEQIGNGINWPTITDISFDPINKDVIYLTTEFGGTIWRSINGGVTWENISGDIPGLQFETIAIDHSPNSQSPLIFVGGATGVFVSLGHKNQAGQMQWIKYGKGLPDVYVSDIEIRKAMNSPRSTGFGFDTIVAGTYGRGVYSAAIDPSTISENVNHFIIDHRSKPIIQPPIHPKPNRNIDTF